VLSLAQERPAASIPPIKRVLPPEGIEIPADVAQRLSDELQAAYKRFEPLKNHELAADIEVFLKAVRYAIDLREFYTEKDFAKADTLLKEANLRITQLATGQHPWTTATGLVVRGYRSNIDDSAQPYGVVIPKNFDFKQKIPLYIWLHGRGDKATDLHFMVDRMTKPGEIAPPNAIVVHAFGRQCVGFLNAGEQDVLDAMRQGEAQYKTDPNRRVLIGFSMGGAGAWHVGAHYAHLFRVVAPGAGFSETARYQKLKPEDYPPWYEQKLWGQNDTPAYVRNLFNTEVIAYSGELDRQIQAARVMEEAYQAEGRTLTHLIGPKTEHKYEPQTKAELLKWIDAVLQTTTGEPPLSVSLQTRTLRYPTKHWITVIRLEEHWQDSRVDAVRDASSFQVTTKNIAMFSIVASRAGAPRDGALKFKIDGQELEQTQRNGREIEACGFLKVNGKWQLQSPESFFDLVHSTVKQTASQGPIDDAFCNRFVVVTPSGQSKNHRFQAWQEFELAHFRKRWKALMRGDFLEKKDSELTDAEARGSNLILWGDEDSNAVIRKVAATLPIKRTGSEWIVGDNKYHAQASVPVLVYPNPANNLKYIVLNSGLTFREAHDRTNSLQNPKLPDWAMIDITQPPDASSPGKIVNAGFFDEEWKLKPPPK
jgi:predicted esterase